jgi:hypothetical protein
MGDCFAGMPPTHVCATRRIFVSMRRSIMPSIQRVSPCLWFDSQAEDAARFYTTVFKNSKIGD